MQSPGWGGSSTPAHKTHKTPYKNTHKKEHKMQVTTNDNIQIRSNTSDSYLNVDSQSIVWGHGLMVSLHGLHNTTYVLRHGEWETAFVVVPVGFEEDFEFKLETSDRWTIVQKYPGESREGK